MMSLQFSGVRHSISLLFQDGFVGFSQRRATNFIMYRAFLLVFGDPACIKSK